MNYIELNGKSSLAVQGLLIQSLPPITKPKMRTETTEIDGRDGDIVTRLGYSAYDRDISIGLSWNYDIDDVIQFFVDNDNGTVLFSNEEDKLYKYEILDQIDFEKLIRFKTAKVKFHVQPFKHSSIETAKTWSKLENSITGQNNVIDNNDNTTITSIVTYGCTQKLKTSATSTNNVSPNFKIGYATSDSMTVRNIGNYLSRPTITIYGNSTINLYINNSQVLKIDLDENTQITIDSEKMEAYNAETLELMNRQVTGNYENIKLNVGKNVVKWDGYVTRLEISNFSRWI